MRVPACIACSLLSADVLKKTNDTCFYNYNLALSTWSHVELVHKNPYPTTQQAQKNVA
jgi:hypothetical protein